MLSYSLFLFTLSSSEETLSLLSTALLLGGGKEVRTPDLRLAKPSLSQLSYTPDNGGPGKTRTYDLTLIRRAL